MRSFRNQAKGELQENNNNNKKMLLEHIRGSQIRQGQACLYVVKVDCKIG